MFRALPRLILIAAFVFVVPSFAGVQIAVAQSSLEHCRINEQELISGRHEVKTSIKYYHCGIGLRHTYGFGAIECLALRIAAFQHSEYEQPDCVR
jgi:hypothetical protein